MSMKTAWPRSQKELTHISEFEMLYDEGSKPKEGFYPMKKNRSISPAVWSNPAAGSRFTQRKRTPGSNTSRGYQADL
jgi:hypothetical protein